MQDPADEAGEATGVGEATTTGVGATGTGVDTGVEGADGVAIGVDDLEQ